MQDTVKSDMFCTFVTVSGLAGGGPVVTGVTCTPGVSTGQSGAVGRNRLGSPARFSVKVTLHVPVVLLATVTSPLPRFKRAVRSA